jgi:hypothetical protein
MKPHRDGILATRIIHPTNLPLHTNVNITPDGHTIHYLGAWIGNGVKMIDGAGLLEMLLTYPNSTGS